MKIVTIKAASVQHRVLGGPHEDLRVWIARFTDLAIGRAEADRRRDQELAAQDRVIALLIAKLEAYGVA